ncbi:MAG: MaoC family dehydratase [Proteobacteria bacterium]|nr:MaoC family dehydratase [Pseudomonadota bacterium]
MPPDAARTRPVVTGRVFDDLAVGDAFTSSLTITEQHLVTGAGLIADFNPLHVDEAFARASRYGGRILHGVLTAAVMGGPIGMIFYGTAIAYLEQAIRFRAPVRPGDTLTTTWTVRELVPKPQHRAGVVALDVTGVNQDGVTVADGDGKVLVAAR